MAIKPPQHPYQVRIETISVPVAGGVRAPAVEVHGSDQYAGGAGRGLMDDVRSQTLLHASLLIFIAFMVGYAVGRLA